MQDVRFRPRIVCYLTILFFAWEHFCHIPCASANPADLVRFTSGLEEGTSLAEVTFGKGIFVAAGHLSGFRQATNGLIISSPDGLHWTMRLLANDLPGFNAITYGNGLFVAVGGTNAWSSSDGIHWARHNVGLAETLTLVCFGNGLFIASTQMGRMVRSEDGVNWRIGSLRREAAFRSIIYGDGKFVALGSTNILISLEGTNWLHIGLGTNDHHLQKLAFGGGLFMAVGFQGKVLTSSNALDWTNHSLEPKGNFLGVGYAGGRFVVMGDEFLSPLGLRIVALTSTDGLVWRRSEAHPGQAQFGTYSIAYGNDLFVVTGPQPVLISSDAIHWAALGANIYPSRDPFLAVAYGRGQFIVAGTPGLVFRSVDGLVWKAKRLNSQAFITGLTYGNGQFVGVGFSRYRVGFGYVTRGALLVSMDGEVWEHIELETPLQAVLHGNGQFVAAGERGMLLTSPDGFRWEQENSTRTNSLLGLAYGKGQFIAVGSVGTVLRSPDGREWINCNSETTNELRAVAYGRNIFAAVGDAGTILTSGDGLVWAKQTVDSAVSIRDIAFGNDMFVGVASSSISARAHVIISTNGLEWTVKNTGFNSSYLYVNAIGYGEGMFVAAGARVYFADLAQPGLTFSQFDPGSVRLFISGVIGRTYQIEAVSDLSSSNWSPIGLVTNTMITTAFSDSAPEGPSRFYRARLLP